MPGRRMAVRRLLMGRPRALRDQRPQLLPQWLATGVFGANPLSSLAYAPEALLAVLAAGGVGALALASPLAAGVAVLTLLVVASLRELAVTYPHGSGPYLAARRNLSETTGLAVAASLLVAVALTVAVSVAAASAVITSVVPALDSYRLGVALVLLAAVTVASARAGKDTGALPAMLTLVFAAVLLGLVLVGLVRCTVGVGGCPQSPVAGPAATAGSAVAALLVLRALAAGAVAVTGVQEVTNGVASFRYPQSAAAARTLVTIGAALVVGMLAVTALARATGATATGEDPTVLVQVATAVLGDGPLVLLVGAATAAVLLTAAHAGYADFPRVASALAGDRFLPRHLVARGDRLMFTGGIATLAVIAGVLLAATAVEPLPLIGPYVLAVLGPVATAEAAMVRHHRSERASGWKGGVALQAAACLATSATAVVALVATLGQGSWAVVAGVALLVWGMRRVRGHYTSIGRLVRDDLAQARTPRPNHVVILLDRVDEAAARALSYARTIAATSISAVGVPSKGQELARRWAELAPEVDLTIAEGTAAVAEFVDEMRARRHRQDPDAHLTAVIPETLSSSWFEQLRQHRVALALKSGVLSREGIVVTDLTSPPGGPGPYTLEDPREHHALVLVSALHQGTARALAYAEALNPTTLQGVLVNTDPQATRRVLHGWEQEGMAAPLDLVDSPLREVSTTLRHYVREFAPDGRATIVTCVIPEFVVPARQRWLHNSTAQLLKASLLFERGVVTTSVPTLVTASATAPLPGR